VRRPSEGEAAAHLVFHQPVGCDAVSGPVLRYDGQYIVTFADRVERLECVATVEALVVFVNPGPDDP
jgi:hypothetical protein